MYYYSVSKIGSGTDSDPYRPNIPDGTDFVGNVSSDGTMYLIATSILISGYTTVIDLQGTCTNFGLNYSDVQTWSVI